MIAEPWQLTVYGIALFVVSAMASALYHGRLAKRTIVSPRPGDKIRIRCGAATFTCTFIRETKRHWIVSPLQLQGGVMPTRNHRDLFGTFGTTAGVAVFTSNVVSASEDEVSLRKPHDVRVRDRRLYPRVHFNMPYPASASGENALIENMGMRGACLLTEKPLQPGDSVRLWPTGTGAQIWGTVLHASDCGDGKYRCRLFFENEVPLSFCWELASSSESLSAEVS